MSENELDILLEEIKATEEHLSKLKKEYREKKTAGVRAAIEARNEADKVLREELRAIGYRAGPSYEYTSFGIPLSGRF